MNKATHLFQSSPAGLHIAELIDQKSREPSGFKIDDSLHIEINRKAIALRCRRMVKSGRLYQSFVSGHPLHYHATKKLADAWVSKTASGIKKKVKTFSDSYLKTLEKCENLKLTILQLAQKADGFSIPDNTTNASNSSIWRCCNKLVGEGKLFFCLEDRKKKRYFLSQEAADSWKVAHAERTQQLAIERISAERHKPSPMRVSQPTPIVRRPYVPPVPRKPAEIVFTTKTKYTVIPTPKPRFSVVDLPFNFGHTRAL